MIQFGIADGIVTIGQVRPLEKLYVEISADCNLDCPMCFRRGFSGPLLSMEDSVLDRVIEQIASMNGLRKLVIAGIGEPLMHSRITELVGAGAAVGAEVWIQTNGLLATASKLLELAQAGLRVLVVSHDEGEIGHPTQGAIFTVAARLGALKRSNPDAPLPRLAMETVLTRENLPHLADSVLRAREAGVGEVIVTNLVPAEENQISDTLALSGRDEMLNDFLKVVEHRMKFRQPRFRLQTERRCDFVDNRAIVVRFDGEVAPCYRFLHDGYEVGPEIRQEIKALSFGNVLHRPIDEIWSGVSYQEFRFRVANWLYPSCPDCPFRIGCSFLNDTSSDCWGNEPSCANCLWSRQIYLCP